MSTLAAPGGGTNTDALGKLASRWLKLVDELQRARFAHGDLQHGNVIIDQQGYGCGWSTSTGCGSSAAKATRPRR